MDNNGQFPGIQPLRPPVPLGPTHVGPPPVPIQFRPAAVAPPQQSQPYNPLVSQQLQQVGFTNLGLPPHVQQYQFSQPPRPIPQPLPPTEVQNRANISVSPQPLKNAQIAINYVAPSSLFTFGVSSVGQPQNQSASNEEVKQPNPIKKTRSVWLEHTAANGKKYYYNRRTKLSQWVKPFELMTPIERADATTDWGEYKSPEGRKYYYNKVTKISKWRIPDELKLAREQVMLASNLETREKDTSSSSAAVSLSVVEAPPLTAVTSSSAATEVLSSTLMVENLSPVASAQPEAASTSTIEVQTPVEVVISTAVVSGIPDSSNTPAVLSQISVNSEVAQDAVAMIDASVVTEEAKNDKGRDGDANITASGEVVAVEEPVVYETKLEAKIAFKELLESVNVGSDWTWDQAMRAIINDRRYGALRTLGERKQAFNEFLVQRKKQDAEERRARHKKALEDFRQMLEESKELTSSSRWNKAVALFGDDERFTAVERIREREDIFDAYIGELLKKEKAKALEEFKRHKAEYLSFLKSCDFISASSQWRRVQDRLEADERCSRLDKIDRLEIFQEYIRDLEREEEEQMKLRMEERRKAERKNREEFRNLMEEHIATGMLTAQTHWRDYCMEVNSLPAYAAVSSNTSGSTAKELFEDVVEELQKQFLEDKTRIKDAVMWRKVALLSTWTLEDFKSSILEDISSPPISDVNLRLVYEELLAVAKEKEEKEAKRLQRLADEFYDHLWTIKSITASSKWEDCKQILEDRQENRFLGEESHLIETFDKFISELQEKARERERRRKEEKAKREREAKERERKRDKHGREGGRASGSKSRKDKDKKRQKRELEYVDVLTVDEDERDRSKSFSRHSSDYKRPKQMEHYNNSSEGDSESRHKRHKKEHRHGAHRSGGDYEEHRDRDFGEEGEVW